MNRSRIILAATLIAIVGAAIPIALSLHYSWQLTVASEQRLLAGHADRVLVRTVLAMRDAAGVLAVMDDFRGRPCSAAHIALMRQQTIDTESIDEVGYFAEGALRCTSWGATPAGISQAAADFVTPDGLAVTTRIMPIVSRGKPMMAVHKGAHNVLINPARFTDIGVDRDVEIAVETAAGTIVATLNDPDVADVRAIASESRGDRGIDEDHLYARARFGGWVAVAMEPRVRLADELRRERILLSPLGLSLAVLIAGGVAWLARRRLSLLGALASAIRRREFVLHYQPIVELATGRCVAAEALVRWRQPDGSLRGPDMFIPLAERSGLIGRITSQVIEMVLADLAPLLEADPAFHVAVNISAEDVRSGRFLAVLGAACARTGTRPGQIWLELTERGFVDSAAASATILRAKALGHLVAIDDFGTGYSSLSMLQGVPLDALKIDKSFIDTIGTDSATSTVTPHIIGMAKTLKLQIVAEGVETQAQAEYLRAHDVEFGQGWLFSRALPADAFIAYYHLEAAKAA